MPKARAGCSPPDRGPEPGTPPLLQRAKPKETRQSPKPIEAPMTCVLASGSQATEMHGSQETGVQGPGPSTEHARHGGHSVCSRSSMSEVMSAGVAQLCDSEKTVALLQGSCSQISRKPADENAPMIEATNGKSCITSPSQNTSSRRSEIKLKLELR